MRASTLGLKEVRVHFGTFDIDVICLVGPFKGVPKFVAWKYDDPEAEHGEWTKNAAVRGRFFHRQGYVPILWIPRAPKTAREHATLAHEMLHAVRVIMEWAGIPLNSDTDEAYCHALGHGVATVLEALRK